MEDWSSDGESIDVFALNADGICFGDGRMFASDTFSLGSFSSIISSLELLSPIFSSLELVSSII